MISAYLEELVLNKVFAGEDFEIDALYVSLHTAEPGREGTHEVRGGGYERRALSFVPVAAGVVLSGKQISFTGLPSVTLTHTGLWDAQVGGNFLLGGKLRDQKGLNAGDTFTFRVGRIAARALEG